MRMRLLLALSLCSIHHAFVVPPKTKCKAFVLTISHRTSSSLSLSSSSSNSNSGGQRQQSRIAGNQRPPTPQEVEVMDQMIDKLANAKPYELPPAVQRAFRVISSPQFFLRIATRQDTASTSEEKEKLAALASNLVSTLEAVVSTTEDRLDERAKQVETVVKAAAEPDSGEFLVPLTPARLEAVQTALRKLDPSSLDESFLSTLDAWMTKSHQDGMDLMVGILQKVLQMYAGLVIQRAREATTKGSNDSSDDSVDQEAEQVFDQLLASDADAWDQVLTTTSVSLSQMKAVVQKNMETIVLGLDAGSIGQRVQAEYLKEMVNRIEALEKR